MQKHLLSILVILGLMFVMIGCAGQVKKSDEAMMAEERGLPEHVMRQARKDLKQSEGWEQFDASGQVKFLQVEDTAAASAEGTGALLDGSVGERLVEVKMASEVGGAFVEWTVANAGPSPVWIVATSKSNSEVPIIIQPEQEISLATDVDLGYCYIVVDNEGGQETSVKIKAQSNGVEAKTVRGKDMSITWF